MMPFARFVGKVAVSCGVTKIIDAGANATIDKMKEATENTISTAKSSPFTPVPMPWDKKFEPKPIVNPELFFTGNGTNPADVIPHL